MTITILLFLGSTDSTFGQDLDKEYYLGKQHWGVGVQAGLMSGMGVAVRFHPVARFGFQFVGGAFKGSDNLLGSIGGEAQFDFDWSNRNRFYGYVGFGYYSNGKNDPDNLKAPLRAGLGVGYDWDISNTLIMNVNLGLTYFTDGNFLPLPQIGLHYLFD